MTTPKERLRVCECCRVNCPREEWMNATGVCPVCKRETCDECREEGYCHE